MFDAKTAWIHIAEIVGDSCVRSQDAAHSVVTYGMGRNIEACLKGSAGLKFKLVVSHSH
jgi:glycerate kinase